MSRSPRISLAVVSTALLGALLGCDKPPAEDTQSTATAATAAPTPQAPTATTAASAKPTAEPDAPKPSHPCPDGSTGDGTFKSPCVAKGPTRLMDVQWTGKMDDKGPSFRVVNNAKLEVLYGSVVVYFYDKDGKQLEVPASGASSKARPKQMCSGNIFAGPMKVGEKAVITFSCVAKSHVPEGATAIEAEMQMVGFIGEDGKKADTYWRNEDITPDARPKGGIK